MRTWTSFAVASAVVAATLMTAPARGQAPTYRVERIASGLRQPVYMTQAPGDPANIIYYMTRVTTGGANAGSGTHGSVWRYNMDTRVSTEVLNLSHRNLTLDLGPQGFTFHPDFNNPGTAGYQKLYVSSAVDSGGSSPVNFVEEYATSGPNGTVPINGGNGQPIVNRTLLQYANVTAQDNHVIDWIGFDPRAYSAPAGSPERDYLFISTGDGSNGQQAQNRPEQKADSLQGKLLRIDVDPNKPDFYPADPMKNFAIPTTNPIPLWNSTHGPNEQLTGTRLNYVSPAATTDYSPALQETYFTGTRNSFRMSMDRLTGDIYSGDVGEVEREEINFIKADPYNGSQLPYDFGYPQREGTVVGANRSAGNTFVTWTLSGGGTAVTQSVNPIQEIPHAEFNTGSTAGDVEIRSTNRSAMIGGYLYRGPIAELQGKYFYTDFVQGNIFSLDFDRNTPLASYSGTNFNQVEVQPGIMAASLGTEEVVLNRNLNSLWHTIMVDPADPTYTPALGQAFGIGRVVSFGEDNAGNLYIVDMGGTRGNAGFGNDYPGGTTGEIFRLTPLVPQLAIKLTVNRDTGAVSLQNTSDAPIDFSGYTIASTDGAINSGELIPVTGNYDIPIPPGNGAIDNNNAWQITTNTKSQFTEQSTGDKGTLAAGATLALGDPGSWIQSIYEDWKLQIKLPDGSTATGLVEFTGNGGSAFDRSDLDFNGEIEPADWLAFRANYFNEFDGLSAAESYEFGDLDGDGDNDFADYRLFQSDYIAANGLAAFQALEGVPEPSGAVLALVAGVGVARAGRRRRDSVRRTAPRRVVLGTRQSRLLLLVASAVAFMALPTPAAHAVLRHRYTFNTAANDSVGTAHGTLFGNATISGGQLILPGGTGDYAALNAAQIDLNSYTDLTVESWFTVDAHQTWARLFDYGDRSVPAANQGYVSYVPQSGGGGGLGIFATPGSARTEAAHSLPTAGVQHHLALVIDDNANGGSDTMSVYLDGVLATSASHSRSLSGVLETFAYVGRSLVDVDPYLDGAVNELRIYNNAMTLAEVQASRAAGPTSLTRLVVNTVTGQATIVTDSTTPIAFDYYEIRSAGGALNRTTWSSLDDQNFDSSGPGAGEGWEEADLSNSSRLAEFFLLGNSDLVSSNPLELGRPFNPSVFGMGTAGDLTFSVALPGGGLIEGNPVVYETPTTYADFNVDGVVDGADFLLWQRGVGKTTGATLADGDADFDHDVDAADLALWQSAYGSSTFAQAAGQAAAQSVPEPAATVLGATGLILAAAVGHRAQKKARGNPGESAISCDCTRYCTR